MRPAPLGASRGSAIVDGRHPLVERLRREEPFIPNDCDLSREKRILLVTGPNMGGKSTYLRQVATIVLLAQAGSFVPADRRELSVVDRIFTRVGAADYLSRGESTFMVEMLEAAAILREATPRSLVILDEVGRGTSTFDGLSIAWALSSTSTTRPRRRRFVLFATHYHELTEIALVKPAVVNATMAVKEVGGKVVFLRKVVPGAADRSYGIHVAELAGPAGGGDRARARDPREPREAGARRPGRARSSRASRARARAAASSCSSRPRRSSPSRSCARSDVNQLTPIAALSLLAALQERLEGSSERRGSSASASPAPR